MRSIVILGLLALSLEGCQKADTLRDGRRAANIITGDDHVDADTNPICKLFSSEEAGSYIGEPVGPPENAAMGSGCAWAATAGNGEVVVAIVSADDHAPPKAAPGFRKIVSPGERGFVVPDMGGWVAGAIVAKRAIRVTVIGKGASDSTALRLLADAASRSSTM